MQGLEDYCNIDSSTSEQHVDLSDGRIKKDDEDIQNLLFWLNQHDPFQADCPLLSLSTGIIADSTINCHEAVELGLKSMSTMVDKHVNEIYLSGRYKVKPLSVAAGTVHVLDGECVKIDSALLLQRLSLVFKGNFKLIKFIFKFLEIIFSSKNIFR